MRAARALRTLLCPHDVSCMLCASEARMGAGTGLCAACGEKLVPFWGAHSFDGVPHYAAFQYGGAAAPLVHGLKYENKRYMAHPLILGLVRAFTENGLLADYIVPVPLHKNRRRHRGYNQSDILARGLGEGVGVPVLYDALSRVRDTPQQVGLNESERMRNVRDAFISHAALKGAVVVVVDDVCTTGATLTACAKALRRRGAVVTLLTAATMDKTSGMANDGSDPVNSIII